MSDLEKPRRKDKLPPLNVNLDTTDAAPRRKKKKPVQNLESEDDSPRAMPPRPRARSNSRSRADPDTDGGSSVRREVPRRAKNPGQPTTSEGEPSHSVVDGTVDGQRPKKKRKPKQPRAESQEELVRNGQTPNVDASESETKPKKKRKRKPQVSAYEGPAAVGLEAELHDLDEDIVTSDNADSVDDKWTAPAIRSQAVNKLYIEQRGGFKTTDKAKVARRRQDEMRRAMEPAEAPQDKNTIQFAIASQRVFKTFTLFLQGLLAGVCLWQVVTVYMLRRQGYDVLLEQYHTLAMPVQAMYYFLLAISTVSVFDRNDVVRPTKRFVLRSVTLQSGAITCLFYLGGLVLSLAAARTDDKIGLWKDQPELWDDTEARDSELSTWVTLNLVRGLMPILGWFVVSLRPQTDRLIKNLEQADENAIGEEGGERPEMGVV